MTSELIIVRINAREIYVTSHVSVRECLHENIYGVIYGTKLIRCYGIQTSYSVSILSYLNSTSFYFNSILFYFNSTIQTRHFKLTLHYYIILTPHRVHIHRERVEIKFHRVHTASCNNVFTQRVEIKIHRVVITCSNGELKWSLIVYPPTPSWNKVFIHFENISSRGLLHM